jgi:hypothetical protein
VTFCLLLALLGMPVQSTTAAPLFDLGISTPEVMLDYGLKDGSLAWGDYDNDGDLDLLITGNNLSGTSQTSVLTNDNGTMIQNSLGLDGVQISSGSWGDYDNDGYLDVLLTGLQRIGETRRLFSAVYHNVAAATPPDPAVTRTFLLLQELEPIYHGDGVWGDYNQDGLLDILLTGSNASEAPFSRIYRNNGSGFEDSGIAVTALGSSTAAWADFDNDGYIDFVISGKSQAGLPTTRVYRNNQNGGFSSASLPTGLYSGTITWIDTNNDGFLELLVTGNSGGETSPDIVPQTLLYRYSGPAPYFTQMNDPGLEGIWSSTVSIGDYNNDGMADLAMAGLTSSGRLVKIYLNNGNGTFGDASAGLPESSGISLAWGDFNQDNTLDLAVSGVYGTTGSPAVEHYYLYVYLNDSPPPPQPNNPPGTPALKAACWNGGSQLILDWEATTDEETASAALTYSLRMGATPGGVDIISPGFLAASGLRPPAPGSSYTGTRAYLNNLPAGDYYWSVQAVDTSYAGGPFADNPEAVIHYQQAVAVADSFSFVEDSSATDNPLTILNNDIPGSGETLSLYSFTPPQHGALSQDGDGTLRYAPNANYTGIDTFYYYALRDSSRYCSRAQVTINVQPVNDAPTGIRLSNNAVAAGSPAGTQIGSLSTLDYDSGQSYTYEFVNEEPNDNEFFSLFRDNSYNPPATFLRTSAILPIDGPTQYQIRVRSTDNGTPVNLSVVDTLMIDVLQGEPATGITLNDNHILEHQVAYASVGQLNTILRDSSIDTTAAKYELVPDPGNPANNYDNDLFAIMETTSPYRLRAVTVFDFDELNAANNIYQVRIRSSEPSRPPFEQVIDVYIDRTLPTVSGFDDNNVLQTGAIAIHAYEDFTKTITLRATEPGINETLHWEISAEPGHGSLILPAGDTTTAEDKTLAYTPVQDWFGSDSFVIQVNDPDGNTSQITINLTVNNMNDAPTIDNIQPVSFPELSGPNTIQVTGITAGPPNETSSTRLLTVTPIRPWYATGTWPIVNPKASAVVNGTATITLNIGVGPGVYPLKIVVSDGQSQISKDVFITVTAIPLKKLYLPGISR